ncbi:MAG TPA: CheR family methyltransferase [Kofleriaceae bacterium]|nr:CheR family methyltransferase [Kofleriaceae bacterium]
MTAQAPRPQAAQQLALEGELLQLAADEAGLELGAPGAAAVARFVERSLRQGEGLAALRARALAREPLLCEALLADILVGETFFFREPEHFRLVADVMMARPRARLGLAAWSAGCASGEEAYSLAATLLAVAGGRPVEVLGADLSARALARACAGTYGRWSRRAAGPMLYPIGVVDGDVLRVSAALRAVTRFARRNLLDPPPRSSAGPDLGPDLVPDLGAGGLFDVVMCRNVLVYLRPDAARRVTRHLCAALAPGGLLILGTFGAVDDPALAPIGPRELGAYVLRPASPAPAAAPPPRLRAWAAGSTPGLRLPPPARESEPVAVHLAAIHLIEARRLAEAEALLEGLVEGLVEGLIEGKPARGSYAPALLELALIAERRDRPARAAELATRLIELLAGRDPDEELAAPEPLPVRYYTTSARAFLARLAGPGGRK